MVGTLSNVAKTKALPDAMAKHVAKVMEEVIARDFTRSDGSVVSEREIGRKMGIPQPTVNLLRKGKGIGVGVLLALRSYTGQSIDALLGLALAEPVERRTQLDEVERKIDAVMTMLVHKPSPNSKAGRALRELERAKLAAVGQKHLDERVRAANEGPAPRKRKAS